jgi:hypothetical protein
VCLCPYARLSFRRCTEGRLEKNSPLDIPPSPAQEGKAAGGSTTSNADPVIHAPVMSIEVSAVLTISVAAAATESCEMKRVMTLLEF